MLYIRVMSRAKFMNGIVFNDVKTFFFVYKSVKGFFGLFDLTLRVFGLILL